MDGERFDDLARRFGAPLDRKRFVGLIAGVFAIGTALPDGGVEARKRRKKNRKRGQSGLGAQGVLNGSAFCEALCDTSGTPRFCDESSSCTSDANCPAFRPYCCTTGSCAGQGGTGVCCSAPFCEGGCNKDSDCPNSPGCTCNTATDECEATICAGGCLKDSDCPDFAGCVCNLPPNDNVQIEGLGVPPGQCGTRTTCGGACVKDSDCAFVSGCVCDEAAGQCVTVTCPGSCTTNQNCTAQGQEGCACFLGVNTADAAAVDAVLAQGQSGACGLCRGSGEPCAATTECCGQLVCTGSGTGATGFSATGTCQHKPKPRRRCKKHGQGCRGDGDCCAQGVCYKGKCGEKDTHCNNDGECAAGYRCQGGPLAPSHRRCRKNGRKRRNKTHRRHG